MSVSIEEHKFLHQLRYTQYGEFRDQAAVLVLDGKFEELRGLAAVKGKKPIQEYLRAAKQRRSSSEYQKEMSVRSQLKTNCKEILRKNSGERTKFGNRRSGELNTPERRKARQVVCKTNSYAAQSNRIITIL